MPKKNFYVVANGKSPGIYTSWDSCKSQVSGFSGAQYKGFETKAEADAYIASAPAPSSSTPSYSSYSSSTPSYSSYSSNYASSSSSNSYGPKVSSPVQPVYSFSGFVTSDPDHTTYESNYFVGASSKSSSTKKSTNKQPEVVYTDGACSGNGQDGSLAGVGVFFGPKDPRNISEPLPLGRQTNQRAELMAAVRALEVVPLDQPLEIRSDSQYLVKGMNEWMPNWTETKWTQLENADLFQSLKQAKEARTAPTTFVHVKGHSGHHGNDEADRLAVAGIPTKKW